MEIVGQGAGERPDQIVTPVLPQADLEDLDFQHIAGHCAFDRDRTGQDMAGHHALASGVHLVEFGRDMKRLAIGHHVRSAADGVDGHLIAAFDGEHGLQFGFEKTPVAGLGAGMQMMVGHGMARIDGALQGVCLRSTLVSNARARGRATLPGPSLFRQHRFGQRDAQAIVVRKPARYGPVFHAAAAA